jgi:hypothetical protein
MQALIAWWCGLIGVSDPLSIQVATGFASSSVLLGAVYMVLAFMISLLSDGRR